MLDTLFCIAVSFFNHHRGFWLWGTTICRILNVVALRQRDRLVFRRPRSPASVGSVGRWRKLRCRRVRAALGVVCDGAGSLSGAVGARFLRPSGSDKSRRPILVPGTTRSYREYPVPVAMVLPGGYVKIRSHHLPMPICANTIWETMIPPSTC